MDVMGPYMPWRATGREREIFWLQLEIEWLLLVLGEEGSGKRQAC